jgi:hypothetical protein
MEYEVEVDGRKLTVRFFERDGQLYVRHEGGTFPVRADTPLRSKVQTAQVDGGTLRFGYHHGKESTDIVLDGVIYSATVRELEHARLAAVSGRRRAGGSFDVKAPMPGMVVAVHASVVWHITQRPATVNQLLIVAFSNSLMAALLSRSLGSMIVVPAITCIMALSLTSYPQLIDRKWLVVTFLVASWLTPVILEQVGVLQPTWEVVGRSVVLSSHVMAIGGMHTALLLIGSNIATFVVFALFASAVATTRRDAMRRAENQAWHLRQLLPAAPSPMRYS